MDAVQRFRKEFIGWVSALNQTKGLKASPDELFDRLEKRLNDEIFRQIGGAFINGWLINESDPNRGYFVKESDRTGPGGGQWMLGHAGGGRVDPCWELYIQLADYGRLRTVAERHGMTTRLEDQLMDITVYAGDHLILYVENKTKKEDALRLLEKMGMYGETGFGLDDPDKGNDPLRKAKYLFRNDAYPKFFALSAIGFEQVFLAEYLGEKNRFLLHDSGLTLTEPILDAIAEGKVPPRSVVDPLALEIERLAGDNIWVSPGTGATGYNFYISSETGDAIFLGVYEDGRVWSDLKALGKQKSNRLANELAVLVITLDISKEWHFWKKNGQSFNLHSEDPLEIASRAVTALFPGDIDNF